MTFFQELGKTEKWMQWASCPETDPDAYFPEKGGSVAAAKRICGGCAVQEECLEFALRNDEEFGVWGGATAQERRALKGKVA